MKLRGMGSGGGAPLIVNLRTSQDFLVSRWSGQKIERMANLKMAKRVRIMTLVTVLTNKSRAIPGWLLLPQLDQRAEVGPYREHADDEEDGQGQRQLSSPGGRRVKGS